VLKYSAILKLEQARCEAVNNACVSQPVDCSTLSPFPEILGTREQPLSP
jgi:hypothetical protein